MTNTFDHLFLMGRPAAGKSEFIDFMKKVTDEERAKKFHIGHFTEVDDFVWLWEKFMEDHLWEEVGCERLYSFNEDDNPGLKPDKGKLFDMMIAKIDHIVRDNFLSKADFYSQNTLIIEFARGMETGYKHSFDLIKSDLWDKAAILYVEVDGAESWKRNVARYEEKLKHSILAHMVPKKTFDAFYSHDDWHDLTENKREGYLNLKGIEVPFVTMNNCPESTDPAVLSPRYGQALDNLMELKEKLK
ncbi:MAG: hypothetical protein ABIE74_06260 [Pseudomonadota bacterium]